MRRYIFIRVMQGFVTLFILSIAVFGLVRLTGDPSILFLSEVATQKDRDEIRHMLGLDKPLVVQYMIFAGNAVRGDFGTSIVGKRTVIELIKDRLPNTVRLLGVAVLMAFVIGFPLGVMAAAKQGRFVDVFARTLAGLGQAMPAFWLGLLMIALFAVRLRILPTSGMGGWQSYLMPGFCLAIFLMSGIIRLLRASMLDVLDTEYIKMARIKGVSERMVIWKHALKNSLLAVVTFSGMQMAALMSGSIVVESIFAWPGFGMMSYESMMMRDFPMIQGLVLTTAVIMILANLITDILYAYLDPRIKLAA